MRNRIVRLGDPNPVVCELAVHAGKFALGHVTSNALLIANWTSRSCAPLRSGCLEVGYMTSQTLGVIEHCIAFQGFVRVMTGDATDPVVIQVVTRTIKDSIRLKTDIVSSPLARQNHRLLEAGVTGATE